MVEDLKGYRELHVYFEHLVDLPNVIDVVEIDDNEVQDEVVKVVDGVGAEIDDHGVQVEVDDDEVQDEVVKVVDVVGAEIDDHGVQVEVDDDLEAEVNDDNAKGAEEDEVRHEDNDSSFDDYDSATDEAYKIDPYEMFGSDEDGEEETRTSYNKKAEKSKEKKGNNGDEDAEKEEIRKKCSNKKSTKGQEKKYVNGDQNAEGEFSRKKGKKRQFDNGGESTSRMRLNSNIYTNSFVDNEYMTEKLHTPECSDNEERAKFPQYNPNIGYGHVKFEIGMEFPNLAEFKKAIKDYGIFEGKDLKYSKNDNVRCRVACKPPRPWTKLCSWASDLGSYQIKTLIDVHSCGRLLKLSCVSAKWIGDKLIQHIRINPNVKFENIHNYIKDTYGVNASARKIYRAWAIAKEIVEGSEREQYSKFWDYCNELLDKNPGSTVQMSCLRPSLELQPHFDRVYVCFEACKRGWLECCRPFIGLDGCFLKGYYG
ncbi:hypothetical protein L6164_013194 [Bauhinia variegata]|uniref:Uncharacterized protein n=1 Tax=Bauhinia variegata TaxID=167791 RepID=A0ACB9PHS9_BAUVA|nr:hypothetical protein L6164_013194 [Bauhinia variegata]